MARVGVFIGQFHSDSRIAFDSLASYAANLRAVEKVRLLAVGPRWTSSPLPRRSAERLDRIVLAGDSPGYFKPAFTRALQLAGGDPARCAGLVQGTRSWRSRGDRPCQGRLACAVHGVPTAGRDSEADRGAPGTLIVGPVWQGSRPPWRLPTPGRRSTWWNDRHDCGHMAMFDKTFPTWTVRPASLLQDGGGERPQDDRAPDQQRGRQGERQPGGVQGGGAQACTSVDVASCVACNACTEICPVSVWSEFDSKLSHRKAIYIPFPQAVRTLPGRP